MELRLVSVDSITDRLGIPTDVCVMSAVAVS